MRKQIGVFLLTGVLLAGGGATAFESQAAITAEESVYEIQLPAATIQMNQEAAAVLQALGKEESYFEAPSCAFQGMDKIYTYKDLEITTYPLNGKEYISSVYFLNGDISTKEGIKIGSSYNDMVKAYGKTYQEQNGVYRYTKKDCELVFYLNKSKVVTNIEYIAITQ